VNFFGRFITTIARGPSSPTISYQVDTTTYDSKA